jgi:RHS repeat-associated protein
MKRPHLVRFGLLMVSACAPEAAPPAYLVYVRDHQGSVLSAIDDRGHQVWRQKQDSFGLRLQSSGQPIPRGFLDQPLDEETGFYQFRYRTYDPASAQWLSPDPLLLENPGRCADTPQACNPYSYAGNRPGEWTDQDGRWVDVQQINGETYVSLTAGVTGPGAQQVAEAMAAGANRFNAGTRVHVSVVVKVYQSLAEIPPSVTPITIEPDVARTHVDTAASRLVLGKDSLALDFDDLQKMLAHEEGHLFGLQDQYVNLGVGKDLHPQSLFGHRDDIMGNFWQSPHGPSFAPELQQLIDNPVYQRNAGLTAPTFDESPPGAIISGEYPGGVTLLPTVP